MSHKLTSSPTKILKASVVVIITLFLTPFMAAEHDVSAQTRFNGQVYDSATGIELSTTDYDVGCVENCSIDTLHSNHFDATFSSLNTTTRVELRNYPSTYAGCKYQIWDRNGTRDDSSDDTLYASGDGCISDFSPSSSRDWDYWNLFFLLSPTPEPITEPTNVTCTTSGTFSTLSWSAADGEVLDYPIRIRENGQGDGCDPTDPNHWYICQPEYDGSVTDTSYTFEITPGNQYEGWIHARDINGNWSEAVQFTCPIEPTPTPVEGADCLPGLNCCTCISEGGQCLVLTEYCLDGYEAECTNSLTSCETSSGCNCVPTPNTPTPTPHLISDKSGLFCDQEGNPTDSATGIINTAIGCIPTYDAGRFIEFYLRWGMGIIGGLSLVLIVYSAFLIITSAGDRNRVTQGKALLGAAITGLLLFLLSAYLLTYIGINILGLPLEII